LPEKFHESSFYNVTPPTSIYSTTQQPDSTSSLHQQSSGEIVYYNNSTDSSDYVTTTSNHSLTPTNAALPGNNLNSGNVSFQQRRGSLQLWQFLIALLDEPSSKYAKRNSLIEFEFDEFLNDFFSSCITWTGRGMEFKLIEPEEVAR
jgi:hypothetical protein